MFEPDFNVDTNLHLHYCFHIIQRVMLNKYLLIIAYSFIAYCSQNRPISINYFWPLHLK